MENYDNRIALMLKEQRTRNNLSIKEVVSLLSEYYQIHVAEKTLYSWESGRSLPSTDVFVALCDLYEVEDLIEAMDHAVNHKDDDDSFHCKLKEMQLIASYREHPELQEGIRKILELDADEKSANESDDIKSGQ